MIYRSTEEQIKEYENSTAMNQSSLKVILKDGIQSFLDQTQSLLVNEELYYEEKEHFIIGKGVDCIRTMGQEAYEKNYFYSKLLKKPGEKAMSVIKLAFDSAKLEFPMGPDVDITLYKDQITSACTQEGYYSKDGKTPETRIVSLMKDCASYWQELSLAEGKQILSESEHYIITTIADSLYHHPHTSGLFQDEIADMVYQFPCYFNYKGVDCKALLDKIVIKAGTIIPLDIKTIGNYVLKFNAQMKKLRYDIQGSFYSHGIKQCIPQLSKLVGKDLSKYRIANFAFIAESTIKPGTPMVFPLKDEVILNGQYGTKDRELLGWDHAISIYKDWKDAGFSLERRFENTNGVVFVEEDFSYSENF